MVQKYHEKFNTFNHSGSQIKFLNTNWYNFRGYLVSWVGSSQTYVNFHYHWNLFKDIKSPRYKSKITVFCPG